VRLARVIRPFAVWCRFTVGWFVRSVDARLLALTLPEREDISRGIASGSSIRKIAHLLERAVSTVSREVARHGGRPEYRADEADAQAWQSALQPKRCLLALHEQLQKCLDKSRSRRIIPFSKDNLQSELNLPRCRGRVSNLPRVTKWSFVRNISREDRAVRQAEIGMIQDVEEFGPELELAGFAEQRQRCVLRQRQIPSPKARPSQHVAASVAKIAERTHGKQI